MNDNDLANTSTAMAVASLCIELIRGDEKLIKRLQRLARKRSAPFEFTKMDEHALMLTDQVVTHLGLRAAHEARGKHSHLMVPIPQDEEVRDESAGALACGSFAVEYIRTHPEVLAAFGAWWDAKSPGREGAANPDTLEAVDGILTMMAAVVHKAGKAESRPEPESAADPGRDDGLRFL